MLTIMHGVFKKKKKTSCKNQEIIFQNINVKQQAIASKQGERSRIDN